MESLEKGCSMGMAQRSKHSLSLWFGAGLLLPGCTEFRSGTDEIEPSTSMFEDMLSLAGAWSCLGEPARASSTPGTLGRPITYTLRLVDISTGEPFTGLSVRACGLTDVLCDEPVTELLVPDAMGWVDIPLTENFSGYLEISGPRALPYVFYLNEGLRTMTDFPLVVLSSQTFAALATAIGVEQRSELGSLAMRTFDCQGNTAAGTVLTTTTNGSSFYFANGLPDVTSTETDGDGIAGFLNMESGVTLVSSELSDGRVVAQRSFIIRAGWMTGAYLRPPDGDP